MRSKLKLIILMATLFSVVGCSSSKPITSRTPTEVELQDFIESKSLNVLAKKQYFDHAIILGVGSVFSLAILNSNKPQYLGSFWDGDPEGIDITAVTQQSPFIGIVIYRNEIIEQGTKMEIVFEDSSLVNISMNGEAAYIIDHPTGKSTNIDKTKVNIHNNNDEVIWTR
ncbi:hypothetical protein DNH61_04795 [Paenibacillus sambharensis]|uniref:Lipoprotein n=1 Tax=Paenibacillus sambharensis TaxID=1803190 RepID=A0A2W1L9S3_9BACL|nr:hypothetical protein [Paenibacillus sambharensis]PZD96968.1 hypothetical protein DNH61_04795 [Paenibacillus sambharensis]